MIPAGDATLSDLLDAYRRLRTGDSLQERILRMREVEGLSVHEIAEEMDLSPEVIARELALAICKTTGFPLLPLRRTA